MNKHCFFFSLGIFFFPKHCFLTLLFSSHLDIGDLSHVMFEKQERNKSVQPNCID